jgi:hypothetical protein
MAPTGRADFQGAGELKVIEPLIDSVGISTSEQAVRGDRVWAHPIGDLQKRCGFLPQIRSRVTVARRLKLGALLRAQHKGAALGHGRE